MQITKVHIHNFKCHEELAFNITKKNCLVYGENGSGKSSIYWALYAVFKTNFRNATFDYNVFKKRNSTNALKVEITLDDDAILKIPRKEETINLNLSKTIYFVNQHLLDELTCHAPEQFYKTVWVSLKKYFSTIKSFDDDYRKINTSLSSLNHIEKVIEKSEVDAKYRDYLDQLTEKVNATLDELGETFKIYFIFKVGEMDVVANTGFSNPTLSLAINQEQELTLHFNEAKLKMAAIAIFFALIKMEEKQGNTLKLLVLDDFITSLDMANRKYIIAYLFKEFKKYQIIIFTHNLQFYHLILDNLKAQDKKKDWAIKNIYLRQTKDGEESIVYDEKSDYLQKAENYFEQNKLPECGNFIRKEFERLVHELEKKYQLGSHEDCKNIIRKITENQPLNEDLENQIKNMQDKIKHCVNMVKGLPSTEQKIKDTLIETVNQNTNTYEMLQHILKELVFYRKLVMHQSSHHSPVAEIYRKEYKGCIDLMKKLKEEMNKIT